MRIKIPFSFFFWHFSVFSNFKHIQYKRSNMTFYVLIDDKRRKASKASHFGASIWFLNSLTLKTFNIVVKSPSAAWNFWWTTFASEHQKIVKKQKIEKLPSRRLAGKINMFSVESNAAIIMAWITKLDFRVVKKVKNYGIETRYHNHVKQRSQKRYFS